MRHVWILLLLLMTTCSSENSVLQPTLFRLHIPEDTGVGFANQLTPSPGLNIITFEYFNNGGGVATGDINQDGLPDLFFSGNMTPSRLYLNEGQFQFRDITEEAGIDTQSRWATGVQMVDLNNDGWLDIYISCAGPYSPERRANLLYINNQDGTFSERAKDFGLADTGHTTQAAFFDYDRDGDLDAYLLTNIMDPDVGPNVIRPKRSQGQAPNTDRLYENRNGHFVDVSAEAGIQMEGYGLGVTVTDIDQDGWLDIYVSNDYLSNDLLYHNQQNGTFRDIAPQVFRHTSYSAMGNDVADINNDQRPDIVTVDMLPPDNLRRKRMIGSINYDRFRSELLTGYAPQYMRNTLQANQGPGPDGQLVFAEIGQLAGIQATDWSWSPLLADIDNDGWKDLLITNGYPKDVTNMDFASYKMNTLMSGQYDANMRQVFFEALKSLDGAHLPNFAYRNQGDWTFEEVSWEWGFQQPSYSHGATLADLDLDGDLDYVVHNTNSPAFIYENTLSGKHYLRVQAKPKVPAALWQGARVLVFAQGRIQYQEVVSARGYQSSVEPIAHFGLDTAQTVDSVVIIWTDGKTQTHHHPETDQVLTVSYAPTDVYRSQKDPVARPPAFREDARARGLNVQHREPHYADFKVQPLLPHKYSQLGPGLTVADVNGDGRDDFYVCGAFQQKGTLFIQQPNGQFQSDTLHGTTPLIEEVAACFFDADGDGDPDLYVGSGGSEFPQDSPYYQDRLYLNDGEGRFSWSSESLPNLRRSTGCITVADYDQDGDLDLFIGSRIDPQQYAEIPHSVLLENQQGQFRDRSSFLPKGGQLGRVSAAEWVDFDQDGRLDLALAGEWMPLTLLRQQADGFIPQSIPGTTGWWNTLTVADLDQDGDPDLAAGNLGRNNPYGVSPQTPLSLRTWPDTDKKRQEGLITFFLQGKEVPLPYRDDLLKWFYPWKKNFPDYTSYGEADWTGVLSPDIRQKMQTIRITSMDSGWLENRGDTVQFHAWPTEAQWGPIQDIAVGDWSGSDRPDVLLIGNNYASETSTGRYDAFSGLWLTQKTNGTFQARTFQDSGFFVPGDGRALAVIQLVPNEIPAILAAQNNGRLLLFIPTKENPRQVPE